MLKNNEEKSDKDSPEKLENNEKLAESNPDPIQTLEYQMLFTELSFNAGLEADRQLLTLSTAGLGLLLALASNKSESISVDGVTFLIFIFSAVTFIYAILVLIKVLDENKKHIVAISNGYSGADSCLLEKLEGRAKFSFTLAISLTILLFALIISGWDLKWMKKENQTQDSQEKSVSLSIAPMVFHSQGG